MVNSLTGRAIRPAYEGIETQLCRRPSCNLQVRVARSAPPMRGLKHALSRLPRAPRHALVARSAPPMRGLKLRVAGYTGQGGGSSSRDPPRL